MNWIANIYPIFAFGNLLLGLGLSMLLGQVATWLAWRVSLLDLPGSLPHKKHTVPMPIAGGITLMASLFAGAAIFNLPIYKELWQIILPSLIVFFFGIWDDFKRLPAWAKFAGQATAGVVLIALGTYVQILQPGFLGLPVNVLIWLNWFITLFWVVGITNAFNFIDSMDGLVAGVSAVALSFMILVMVGSPQITLLRLLTLMLGVCFGLYFYNTTPAKFFLGDSGAQTVGFLLAAVAIQFTPGTYPQASSWFLPILIMGVPIFDTTLVVYSRLRQKRPFYSAGTDHTYHRLVDLGLDSTRAVQLMHLATISLSCLAFIALKLEPLFANLIFACVCLLGGALILWFDHRKVS